MTLGTMKTRIASDLQRSDLTSAIGNSIRTAISYYESRNWPWNDTHASATVTSQEYVALPTRYKSMRSIRAVHSSGRNYKLNEKSHSWMEENADSANTGTPIYYCINDEQVRLYPIPDSTATLNFSFYQTEATAVSDSATNAWFSSPEAMIRYKAKALVLADQMHDFEKAMYFEQAALQEEVRLLGRKVTYTTGEINPWL